jgi:hypothetical protein
MLRATGAFTFCITQLGRIMHEEQAAQQAAARQLQLEGDARLLGLRPAGHRRRVDALLHGGGAPALIRKVDRHDVVAPPFLVELVAPDGRRRAVCL